MVDVPPNVRRDLFPRFVRRGSVLRVERYPLPEPKDKYIVLLNLAFDREGEIHHVLTTSQVQGLPFRDFAVVIPQGSVSFFSRETAIACREVYSLYFVDLEDRYVDGTLEFAGELPADVIEAVDAILRRSPYLAPSLRRHVVR